MGGGKKSKAPAAPDYSALAQQQGESSKEIAQAVTQANRPTQVDAMGNRIDWTQDANGNWTQTQSLNQANQAINQGMQSNQLYATGMAGQALSGANYQNPLTQGSMPQYQQAGAMPSYVYASGKPVYSQDAGDKVADALFNSVMNRVRPQQTQDTAALDNRLRLQGLQPGTEAYDRAARNLSVAQGDVNAQAGQQAVIGGYDEALKRYMAELQGQQQEFNQNDQSYRSMLAGQGQDFGQKDTAYKSQMLGQGQDFAQRQQIYNQPLQQAALLQQIAGSSPQGNFTGFSGATGYNPTDLLGAANAQYQAKMGATNASNAKKGGTLSSGLGFAGSLLGGK